MFGCRHVIPSICQLGYGFGYLLRTGSIHPFSGFDEQLSSLGTGGNIPESIAEQALRLNYALWTENAQRLRGCFPRCPSVLLDDESADFSQPAVRIGFESVLDILQRRLEFFPVWPRLSVPNLNFLAVVDQRTNR